MLSTVSVYFRLLVSSPASSLSAVLLKTGVPSAVYLTYASIAFRHGSYSGSPPEYPHVLLWHSSSLAWYTRTAFPSSSTVKELCPGPYCPCKSLLCSAGVGDFVQLVISIRSAFSSALIIPIQYISPVAAAENAT